MVVVDEELNGTLEIYYYSSTLIRLRGKWKKKKLYVLHAKKKNQRICVIRKVLPFSRKIRELNFLTITGYKRIFNRRSTWPNKIRARGAKAASRNCNMVDEKAVRARRRATWKLRYFLCRYDGTVEEVGGEEGGKVEKLYSSLNFWTTFVQFPRTPLCARPLILCRFNIHPGTLTHHRRRWVNVLHSLVPPERDDWKISRKSVRVRWTRHNFIQYEHSLLNEKLLLLLFMGRCWPTVIDQNNKNGN